MADRDENELGLGIYWTWEVKRRRLLHWDWIVWMHLTGGGHATGTGSFTLTRRGAERNARNRLEVQRADVFNADSLRGRLPDHDPR